MRLLLDTHIFLWVLDDDPKLSNSAWTSIELAEEVYISSASIWEATIKYSLGKLSIKPDTLAEAVTTSGFIALSIKMEHAVTVQHLKNIHNDPFDRMLIAQAISEPMHLMTADRKLSEYSELIFLV